MGKIIASSHLTEIFHIEPRFCVFCSCKHSLLCSLLPLNEIHLSLVPLDRVLQAPAGANVGPGYPPAQGVPPAGGVYPPPQSHAPPFTMPGQPPSYNDSNAALNQNRVPPALPPNHPSQASAPVNDTPQLPDLPDLPQIPNDSMPTPGGRNVGGESVDFDDLTKRFEELKKRK